MNLSSSQKIAILGMSLLVLAGIIVVALKGMNVDLMFTQHKSINIVIGSEFDIRDVQTICNEVFKNKKTVIRKIGTFGDSANINVVSITDEEKVNLVEKVNERFNLKLDASKITISSNPNIRIRDLIRPYITPVSLSLLAIYAYIGIRFRKLNVLKVLLTITGVLVITEALMASLIAIVRIPVTPVVVNILLVIGVIEILVFINKKEEEVKSIGLENKN